MNTEKFDSLVKELCFLADSRCGLGWGKFPYGVMGAIKILLPHVSNPIIANQCNELQKKIDNL